MCTALLAQLSPALTADTGAGTKGTDDTKRQWILLVEKEVAVFWITFFA